MSKNNRNYETGFFHRNEFEMCEIFDTLLFSKTERFLSTTDREDSAAKHFKLSESGIQLLDKLNILGNFRRPSVIQPAKSSRPTKSVEDIVFDPERLWFSPCAFFRITEPVYQYFR
ncbi:MAG: hypothetical protein HY813_00065 [Candidatus Portnoybacteria bacterium]|nr:hypothetical protein [Candidatus Portnoybacteria bacterium]